MIGWWRAEGDATDTYSTNDGTLVGDAAFTTSGKAGQAFSFDGNGDYVELANESQYDFVNQQFTLEGWFKTSATGTYNRLSRRRMQIGNGVSP